MSEENKQEATPNAGTPESRPPKADDETGPRLNATNAADAKLQEMAETVTTMLRRVDSIAEQCDKVTAILRRQGFKL